MGYSGVNALYRLPGYVGVPSVSGLPVASRYLWEKRRSVRRSRLCVPYFCCVGWMCWYLHVAWLRL